MVSLCAVLSLTVNLCCAVLVHALILVLYSCTHSYIRYEYDYDSFYYDECTAAHSSRAGQSTAEQRREARRGPSWRLL